MTKPTKVNLIEHFYEHLAEPDWLDGVDLYQAGRVNKLQIFEGLITGTVTGHERGAAEVRVKTHPSGHYIQWIECTCKKNRQYGQYCEHIAALMIHIDREKPEIFARLDARMPLKPPTPPARARIPKPAIQAPERSIEKGVGAASTLLTHLKGSINSVSLLAHGPAMRVRIEIKAGSLTHYDLDLDAAAKFLESHPKIENASAEVLRLAVWDIPAELGTKITQAEGEKIVAERGVIIRATKQLTNKNAQNLPAPIKYKRLGNDGDSHESNWFFFGLKSASKYVGKNYFFIPDIGYFPLLPNSTTAAWQDLPLTRTFKEDEAAEFAQANYQPYRSESPIWLDESLMAQVVLEAPKLSEVELIEERDGWFRLDPRYGKGKSSVSMATLMKHLRNRKRKYIRTGDVWMKIPELVTQFKWQLDQEGDAITVDAVGLLRMKAAVGEFDSFAGSKSLLNKLRNRMDFDPATEPPKLADGSKLSLRHYQETGLKWLWWLYRNNLHGLLADEMGLGKTHQAMALMTAIQNASPKGKFLVICPTTVLDHWLDKANDFCPNLRPMKYHGASRLALLRRMESENDLMITSYGVLLRDIKHLAQIEWESVVLDEAHFVKNNETATYQAVCRLRSKIRVCLTGTPMENDLSELKNIFDFLVPGYLGSDEYFKRNYMSPITAGAAPEAELGLQKLIYPFKMRRTKVQVLPDLPAKIEDIRHCALSDEQIKMYRDIVAMKAKPLVEQLQNNESPIPYLHVFATISLLKQVCDHPALVTGNADYTKHESGKFELLKGLLEESIGSGHKIVIYTQYLGMIEIIRKHLESRGVGHVVLNGQTRNRGEVINTFQTKPDCRVFIGSLLAGGIGIDLTAASEVIHYDRWWNASKENQATDRVHRIGQEKNVQVLKLVTRGTLEEKIDSLIAAKAALFEKFMDRDEDVFKNLSRQELIELLQ